MKRLHKTIGPILIFAMCLALLGGNALASGGTPFPDVDGYEEFAEAIAYVSETGIMIGDDNGNFNPYKTVSRAEMATLICRMLGVTEGLQKSSNFTDVPTSHWANAYVSQAVELGIINGYGNGKFGPSDNVTYEQAVTMVVRAIGATEAANEYGGYPSGFLAIAEEAELTANIQAEIGEPLSRSDIATIIYAYFCNNSIS